MHSCWALFEKFQTVTSSWTSGKSSRAILRKTCFADHTGFCVADSTLVEKLRLQLKEEKNKAFQYENFSCLKTWKVSARDLDKKLRRKNSLGKPKSLTHKYSTLSKHRVQAEPQICSFQSFSNPLQTKWSPPDSCPQSTKPFESTHLIVAELW